LNTLYVVAHPAEAQAFQEGQVLVTGFGKIPAAVQLAKALATGQYDRVIVYGTAGRLDSKLAINDVYEVCKAYEHDSYQKATVSTHYPQLFEQFIPVKIATGDSFISSEEDRLALIQQGCGLVDMESYAYLEVGNQFNIPTHIIKIISDDADAEASTGWDERVKELSQRLLSIHNTVCLEN
jgi:adenosylhomocysteine nucleosidase